MPSMSATLTPASPPRIPELLRGTPETSSSIKLCCPQCNEELDFSSYRALTEGNLSFLCKLCSFSLKQQDGIWLGLTRERQARFAQFVQNYEHIRKAEGRGSDGSKFYLALPFQDLSGRNSRQWSIRATTFRYIEQKILPQLNHRTKSPLSILDLGAGNGWLSHRLARMGHRPVAVDLLINSYDGLGAASHYQSKLPELFPRFQAEVDCLPFADGQFDCAIFNASFHYSENYDRTLTEAIRCLRPGGTILIADSPTYSREASGQQMRQERNEQFLHQFGFRSDELATSDYLTPERLISLEVRHDLEWITHRVWHGMRWACRPWIAKLRRRREPSQFFLYAARVKTR